MSNSFKLGCVHCLENITNNFDNLQNKMKRMNMDLIFRSEMYELFLDLQTFATYIETSGKLEKFIEELKNSGEI